MDARTTFAYAANRMDRRFFNDPRPFRTMQAMWRSSGIGSSAVHAQ
jgi:hypothetical protein